MEKKVDGTPTWVIAVVALFVVVSLYVVFGDHSDSPSSSSVLPDSYMDDPDAGTSRYDSILDDYYAGEDAYQDFEKEKFREEHPDYCAVYEC